MALISTQSTKYQLNLTCCMILILYNIAFQIHVHFALPCSSHMHLAHVIQARSEPEAMGTLVEPTKFMTYCKC